MVILGSNFGSERGDGRVEFDGAGPTASSYLGWYSDRIELKVPLYAESALVRVVTPAGESNAMMFMSRDLLPTSPAGASSVSLGPSIESLSSDAGAIGSLLVIKGLNFGANRGDSSVLFTWTGETSIQVPNEDHGRGTVSPSEALGEYEGWSDKEIRVRVPDGAVTGGVTVRTARGSSAVRYFQVVDAPGAKTYAGRKTYALSTFVAISRVKATVPSALYLWMPFPVESPSQRSVKALGRSAEPLFPDHKGLSAYRIVDPAPDTLYTLSQDYVAHVYGVATDIKPDRIKAPPAPVPPLYTTMVTADALVPADHPDVTALARKAVGREKNPYRQAKAILDALGSAIAYDASASAPTPAEALKGGKADAWDTALLYTAALRAAGIPALPVAGVVMDDSKRAWPHAWTEFYIYGFGWVPVDPTLALGASPGSFVAPFSDRSLYFGSMDDRHIAFSRGLAQVDRLTPDGRTVTAPRRYSFQTVFEEATGEIAAYTSFWSDVEITGVY